MSTLQPFTIKIKATSKNEGKEKRKESEKIHLNPQVSVSVVSFYSKICVAFMYLKASLRISELESTDNLSSPYNIDLSKLDLTSHV